MLHPISFESHEEEDNFATTMYVNWKLFQYTTKVALTTTTYL